MKLSPRFVYDEDDKKVGVVLPVGQFEWLIGKVEDYSDYLIVKEIERKPKGKTYSLEDIEKELQEKR